MVDLSDGLLFLLYLVQLLCHLLLFLDFAWQLLVCCPIYGLYFLSVDKSIFYVYNMQDQEVLEARRARDEKDDRLRDALASAAALKEELQNLKRLNSAQISVDKAGPSYSQDDEDEAMIAACDDRQIEVIHAHAKAQSKKLDQGQETWAASWEIEKPQDVAAHKAVTPKVSFDATVLKARTVDDGILSSYQRFLF